jgi:aquaporin Z
MNPAVTLTFFRLGKIAALDTVLYVLAQFGGGIAGVMLSLKILGPYLADPPVTYLVTEPGVAGNVVALLVEIGISFVIMMLVLTFSNSRRLAPYTGVVAGAAVLIFIIIASPISGMSMNPARSFASALAAHEWRGFWIYVVAPLTGMLAASQTYLLWRGYDRVYCAKLAHNVSNQCIFRCNHSAMVMGPQPRTDPDQQRKSLVDRNEKP